MAFDFKKEFKEFYLPKDRPEIVTVPEMNYIAVQGRGDPNQEGGAYQRAMGVLYAVAYTLKMSYKSDYRIKGFFEYVVPPLEGFWQQEGGGGIDYGNKDGFLEKEAGLLRCGVLDGGGGPLRPDHASGLLRLRTGIGGEDGRVFTGARLCRRPERGPAAP